jgi:hypothetical protein
MDGGIVYILSSLEKYRLHPSFEEEVEYGYPSKYYL